MCLPAVRQGMGIEILSFKFGISGRKEGNRELKIGSKKLEV